MGGGSWTARSFASYSTSKGYSVDTSSSDASTWTFASTDSAQEMFKQRIVASELNPLNIIRECCDSEEHPNTVPVILALDVTGSMGTAATEVAKKLNVVMTKLYNQIADVEFCVMGIGDLACDYGPIQMSQFESDIRIAEQLDKVWFEFGGGGNMYESYTAAWYMGSRHTKLDCWNRGKKGIIITMGDETLNPYLPKSALQRVTGDAVQADVETKNLYEEASQKFDIYHLNVVHRRYIMDGIEESFGKYLDGNHYRTVTLDNIAEAIVDIIVNAAKDNTVMQSEVVEVKTDDSGAIVW